MHKTVNCGAVGSFPMLCAPNHSVRTELIEASARPEIFKMRRIDRELRRCGKFRCKILRNHARI
jgi:hypothetical protein